jgi:hypothetical protein
MRALLGSIAKGGARVAITAAFAAATTGSAWATVTSISSNATDLKVALNVAGLNATVATGTASGTAGSPYNVSNTFVAANQSLGLGTVLGSALSQGFSNGVMTASAQSAFPGAPTGSASATVNNLGLGLALNLGILGTSNLLSLGSSAISSTTTFDGSNFIGVSSIADLTLSNLLGPISFNSSLLASSAANRVLVDILGLKITLNEQIGSSLLMNGITTQSLTTNALHVAYNGFALANGSLLNGDIIVGQSQVSATQVAAVPEPATWVMSILGFGMIGAMLRRKPTEARALA